MIFYTVARAEFLLWNWSLFKQKEISDILWSFIVGWRFDISSILMMVSPLLLLSFLPWPKNWESKWSTATWILFCILQTPFLILNLVDTEFINFVGRRTTFDSLFVVNEAQGKMLNFIGSYWQLFLVNTIIVFTFVGVCRWVMKRVSSKQGLQWAEKGKRLKLWTSHAFLCFVTLILAVIGIRGGLQGKPISFVNANVFTAPLLNNLVLNSTFTFVKSYGAESLARAKYFNEKEEMLKNLNGVVQGSKLEGYRPTKPQNVVIVILESFGEEYLGPVDGKKSYTPFLDSLKTKSLVFNNAYANGRRSIEGVGAVMAGIPALMSEPFISSHFTSNYFVGLGTLLGQKNYSTAFFHGGHNGTMYFDSFMQSAGVEKYFGSREYGNSADDDGVWGIWDEPFLQWMLTQMDSIPQPFMTSVFTLSSHQPYKVPEQYKAQFPEGPIEILKAVSYSDFALQKFFAEAEKKPWFKDTLFIITADHASMHYRPEYTNDLGSYKIPLILYHPSYQFPKTDTDMIAQQIDILPTVLDFLGIPEKERNYLGSSLFAPADKVVVNFNDGHYLLVAKDHYLRWAPTEGEAKMYAINDRESAHEIHNQQLRKEELTTKLKATVQYFNEGMWDNKLYYPTR